MAEGVSFALTRLAATPAFQAGALLDSANLPMAEDAGFPPALPHGRLRFSRPMPWCSANPPFTMVPLAGIPPATCPLGEGRSSD